MALRLADEQILIHVGLHKTASTWLQEIVFAPPDYGFAAPWGGMAARAVTEFVTADPIAFDPVAARASFETAAPASTPPGSRLVISHEALSSRPMTGEYYAPEVARRLKAAFPNSRLFVVIREQKSLIYSLYAHSIVNGARHGVEDFIGTGAEPPGWAPLCRMPFFDFDALHRCYADIFGPDRVLMLPMEMLRDDHDGFCARLLDFAELPRVAVPKAKARNVGLRAGGAALARSVNALVQPPALRPLRGSLFHLTRRGLRVADRLTPAALHRRIEARVRAAIATRVEGRFAAGNARLSGRIGLDLARYGYE